MRRADPGRRFLLTETTPPEGKVVLEGPDMRRALKRLAHEVLERNGGASEVLLVGIHRRGVPLAERLSDEIESIEGEAPPVGTLDVSFYRDDLRIRTPREIATTDVPFAVDGKVVVLVDDVLFTGRTIRAAIDALVDFGRPRLVQLAVLVDRGHRELPIRADFIGKNVPTSPDQDVEVRLLATDGADEVRVVDRPPVRLVSPAENPA